MLITVSHHLPFADAFIQDTSTDINALTNKAITLARLGNYQEAIVYYNRALAIDPTNIGALVGRGVTLGILGNYQEAIVYFDRALAIDPTNIGALTNKGNALAGLGNYQEAIVYYNSALAINPNDIFALVGKGVALAGLGNYQEAIVYYNSALAINPNYTVALDNKGNALAKLGRYNEAIENYDKAIQVTSTNTTSVVTQSYNEFNYYFRIFRVSDITLENEANAHTNAISYNNKGWAYFQNGQYGLAIASYNLALQENQNFSTALYNRGEVLDKIGKHDEAQLDYQKALEIDPNGKGGSFDQLDTGLFTSSAKVVLGGSQR